GGEQGGEGMGVGELLEGLKREDNGARHVPMSVGNKGMDSRGPAGIFDQSVVAYVELRRFPCTARRHQRCTGGASTQSGFEVLNESFGNIVLAGKREEPAMPEAEFHPRADPFSGQCLQPGAQRGELTALRCHISGEFYETCCLREIC